MNATILFAHGSRDPTWRAPMDAVAQRMRTIDPAVCVECAFLEHSLPSLPDTVAKLAAQGAMQVTVVPMFLGLGKHVREDLPQLVDALRQRFPALKFVWKKSTGEEQRVIDVLARLALDQDGHDPNL